MNTICTSSYSNSLKTFFWALFIVVVGVAVASCWVRLLLDRAVRVQALAGDIALCSWSKRLTLTVPNATQIIFLRHARDTNNTHSIQSSQPVPDVGPTHPTNICTTSSNQTTATRTTSVWRGAPETGGSVGHRSRNWEYSMINTFPLPLDNTTTWENVNF